MASGDAYDVFISYARSDQAAAAELNGWLCAQGFSTFFDRSALRPGLRWVPALEEAIGRSKAVAILVGPHGIGNTQQYERELALIRQTADPSFPVIPVMTPGCDAPPTGFLKLLTWVDLSKGASVLQQIDNLESLRAALRREQAGVSPIRASICPYRGLEPFHEEDVAFFCGRDGAIRELVGRVQAHNLVAVVGPSGSGKSSLVFAGLLPALRKQGRTTMWDVVTLRPGKSPLSAFSEAFGVTPDGAGPAAIDTWLEGEAAAYRTGDKDKLARIVDRRLDAAPEQPDRLLIYVDQWEELYAMAPALEDKPRLEQHSADVDRFIELLVSAASGAGSRASVVLTVRADFYNPLIRNPLIAALLPRQQVNIPPMSRDDLRSAIERPAQTAGLSFAPPKLVDRILDEVGLEEGRLPLLQFALKETWQRRDGERLTAEAYTEVGGVAGAIEKTAEDAYERLTPSQKDAARRLFLRLVTPGEGQADTRARSLIPDDSEQRDIVGLFANPRTRLLVTGYETLQGAERAGNQARSTVEVAHEALIQRWPTLRNWVRANRENMRARAAILRAKAEWEENRESERFLLDPGVQLERGRALLANPGDVAVDDIRNYVRRSIDKNQSAFDEAKRRRRRNWIVASCALLVVTVVLSTGLASSYWGFNDYETSLSFASLTDAEAAMGDGQYEKAMRFALNGLPPTKVPIVLQKLVPTPAFEALLVRLVGSFGPDWSAVEMRRLEAKLAGSAQSSLLRVQLSEHKGPVRSIMFRSDGASLITASDDGTARVWDSKNGSPIRELDHGGQIMSAEYSQDNVRIVTASSDGRVAIWDGETAAHPPTRFKVPIKLTDGKLWSAKFSPDGKLIVTTSDDGFAVWRADSPGTQPLVQREDGKVTDAVFSPDGTRLAATLEKTVAIFDASNGNKLLSLKGGHTNSVRSVAFNLDGTRIVTASFDNTAQVWDANTGDHLTTLKHSNYVIHAEFSPDGQRIVTACWDGAARVWDAITGTELFALNGHAGAVVFATFSPSGQAIATASEDGTGRIWDANNTLELDRLEIKNVQFWSAMFVDPARIVTVSNDNVVRIWDVSKPGDKHVLLKSIGKVRSAAVNRDATRIATASEDGFVRVWDAKNGQLLHELADGLPESARDGKGIPVNHVAFSRDGDQIVTASNDGFVRVWNAETGKLLYQFPNTLPDHDPHRKPFPVRSAAFSPDSSRIVTASDDKLARVWDVRGAAIVLELKGHQSTVWSAAFSPDGTRIVTASWDHTARIWDSTTGVPVAQLQHGGIVWSAAFSPDGTRVVTASWDKTARVWDTNTGEELIRFNGHNDAVRSAEFSPDSARVVTWSEDGTARVWDSAWLAGLRGEELARRVCVQKLVGSTSVFLPQDVFADPILSGVAGQDPCSLHR